MHSSRNYTHINSYGHKIGAVILTLALAACPGKAEETDTDATTGDATTDSGDTTSESTAPTTGGAETGPATTDGTGSTTDDGATGGMTETGDPVTTGAPDDTTTGDTETGGAGPVEECMAACSKIASCDPMSPVEECTQECAAAYAGRPACTAAGGDLAICVAGLDCEQIALFQEGEPTICEQQLLATDEACGESSCGFVSGVGPGQCSLSYQCENGPFELYECEKDSCTCVVDGVASVSCPVMQFCTADMETQQQMAAECCGFAW